MKRKTRLIILFVGLFLIIIGAKLNFIVIMNNNGKMPLNLGRGNYEFGDYILYTENSQVENWYLGDIINIGSLIAFSPGDVLMVLGVGLFVFQWGKLYRCCTETMNKGKNEEILTVNLLV